jgi:hypothetical protein
MWIRKSITPDRADPEIQTICQVFSTIGNFTLLEGEQSQASVALYQFGRKKMVAHAVVDQEHCF